MPLIMTSEASPAKLEAGDSCLHAQQQQNNGPVARPSCEDASCSACKISLVTVSTPNITVGNFDPSVACECPSASLTRDYSTSALSTLQQRKRSFFPS